MQGETNAVPEKLTGAGWQHHVLAQLPQEFTIVQQEELGCQKGTFVVLLDIARIFEQFGICMRHLADWQSRSAQWHSASSRGRGDSKHDQELANCTS